MSSGDIIKLNHEKFQEEPSDNHLDISKIVIPFSKLFKKYNSSDIYSGTEKIPFKERNIEYRVIFKEEFGKGSKIV
ncbi:MAG: hypothetical protein ACFFEY_12920 [Candidatus Thorarchaeota archaeon]